MTVTSRWPKDVVDVMWSIVFFASWTRNRRNGTRSGVFPLFLQINVILSTTGESNRRVILYYQPAHSTAISTRSSRFLRNVMSWRQHVR